MDTRALGTAVPTYPHLATVGENHRPKIPEGKAKVSRNAYTGGAWREARQLTKEMNALLREQRDAVEAIT
ncbi:MULTISPECIES: hypothetical protein [unclassified Variovorax]|uniref:hypothetical protein n=1 Tax=unclassified Variovorax TaxID=663243 RepID=UPI0011602603|nr:MULTISPECIES: hypothetical protein [unclassified Variovorax]